MIRSGVQCEFADVSKTNLGFIERRLKNRGLESQTYLLPGAKIEANAYDFVLAMDVLEHVPDPVEKLKEIRNFLKPGGVVLFNVITSDSDDDPLHIMQDPTLIRKQVRGLGYAKIGSIGEFKIYQRVERPQILNHVLRALDSAFWSFRIAVKGH